MQRIVTIGGGTGQNHILRGLKEVETGLTAVVNMCDDGGSSRRLRDEHGFLPPGDLRQCLVALTEGLKGEVWRDVFNYRFNDGNGLKGHNFGNLLIYVMSRVNGSLPNAIEFLSREVLGIKDHKVIPVSQEFLTLMAETEEGEILQGQFNVSYPKKGTRIKNIFYKEDPVLLYRKAGEEIRHANKVVICAGDLYGSVLPNFIVKGMREALSETSAGLIYVCNLFTKEGNYGFTAGDFVAEVEKYAGRNLDHIVISNSVLPREALDLYLKEGSELVRDDLGDDSRVIRGDYTGIYPNESKTLLRHRPEGIAKAIMEI